MKTVSDLCAVMQEELSRRGLISPPRLLQMLETMYRASLATEEGVPTRVQVAYANPTAADASPEGSLMHEIGESLDLGIDRRRCVPLRTKLIFSPTALVKLAAGVDARTSIPLVYDFGDQTCVWGLADMQDEFSRFSTHRLAPDSRPDRPGDFQIHVEGVGHLRVFIGFERIAELRQGELLPQPIDVLAEGPVHAILKPTITRIYAGLRKPGMAKLMTCDYVERMVLSAVYQLLIRTERLHHGGAFLITPDISNKQLHITNQLQYTRLLEGIAYSVGTDSTWVAMLMLNLHLLEVGQDLPVHLWAEEHRRFAQARQAERILDGAIWFTSLLTRVDGLVLLDDSLLVRGFGVILEKTDMPPGIEAVQSTGPEPRKSTARPLYLEGFGTRHRSMAAYCARNPGSVGFVASKDGGVRAFKRVGKQLIMWDDIMLYQAPLSQGEIRTGENVLREILKEAEEGECQKSEPASSRKSKEFERLALREYRRLFRVKKRKEK